MPNSFLEGLLREEQSFDIKSVKQATQLPPWPATTKVAAESRANYATLANNPSYGLTGLMAVNTWQTSCYDQVRPGYVWLFPGAYSDNPPAYNGTVSINCATHSPLLPGGGALHAQLCALLGQPSSNFVGFAIAQYPYSASGSVHYNSCTCNVYWFGTCALPTNDGNGHNWQQLVYNTLSTWLQ